MPIIDSFSYISNIRKSREELLEIQWKALKRTLHYAYRKVPFYSRRFDAANIKPQDIKKPEDMFKIPLLTKEELQQAGNHIIATGLSTKTMKWSTTSGSTGQPINTAFTRSDWFILKYLLKFRSKWICGLRPWHKIAIVVSNPQPAAQKMNNHFLNILFRKKVISISQSVEAHLKIFEYHRPDALYGTISYFNELKDYLMHHNIHWLKPRFIFSSGEIFDPVTKQEIESFFNCPVYDIYGSTELKEISWECPSKNGYHINVDAVYVEFIGHNRHTKPDEEGYIAVTSLVNRGMPLIRYLSGDKGMSISRRCPDCFDSPMMRPITGRNVDYFSIGDGKRIAPFTLIVALHDFASEHFSRFQVIQESSERVTLKIIPKPTFTKSLQEGICRIYQNLLGETITINIELVDTIEREKTGKFQIVKSLLNQGPGCIK